MKREILGVKIDSLTFAEAIKKIDQMIVSSKSSQIVTVNPEMVMAAKKDREFRQIINSADLAVPDGAGIMWAGNYLEKPFRERITGVDLTWAISKLAEDRGYRVFFLGAEKGIAKEASIRIKKLHPRLKIAGVSAGGPKDEKTVETLRRTTPDILFVAFGAPKQEKFIIEIKKQGLKIPLAIGVGGTFDYIAGLYPYAPEWMRKAGLEWLFRLLTQPRRWNRIITATIRFPWAVFIRKLNL